MYFPYMRGKRFELLAIRDLASLVSSNNIIPVIEPVRESLNDLQTFAEVVQDEGIELLLITNPQVGDLVGRNDFVEDDIINDIFSGYNDIVPTLIVDSSTTQAQINSFTNTYPSKDVGFFHSDSSPKRQALQNAMQGSGIRYHVFREESTSHSYRSTFTNGNSVLLGDEFPQAPRNADYPRDNFFTDLHQRYTANHDGFGDYLTVGDEFMEQGFAPYAIALHLTHEDPNGDIRVKHFVSDRTDGPEDPGGKFLNALNKLINFVNSQAPQFNYSSAVDEFAEYHNENHFPGLGKLKEVSMRHHIELMNKFV